MEEGKSMKRFHVMAVALVAVFAVSMVAVAASSAVEFLLALWLANGEPVTAALLVETEGELEIVASNGLGVTAKSLCSWILDGWVGSESLDFVSELLSLSGTLIPTMVLTGTPLLCANSGGCTEPEIWADIPFESEVVLMIDGTETFLVDLLVKAGWYAQCLILGVTTSELCETPAEGLAMEVRNEVNGTVAGFASEAFQVLSGGTPFVCTSGRLDEVNSVGASITLEPGVTLSVSSE
jgi:hypothetical protein